MPTPDHIEPDPLFGLAIACSPVVAWGHALVDFETGAAVVNDQEWLEQAGLIVCRLLGAAVGDLRAHPARRRPTD